MKVQEQEEFSPPAFPFPAVVGGLVVDELSQLHRRVRVERQDLLDDLRQSFRLAVGWVDRRDLHRSSCRGLARLRVEIERVVNAPLSLVAVPTSDRRDPPHTVW